MLEEEIKITDKFRDIVVVVVEGSSDKLYLEVPLNLIFEKKYGTDARFIVISDITGDIFFDKNDVCKGLDTYVEGELRKPSIMMDEEIAKHIIAVYHIIDIDQSFISDDLIHKADYDYFHYENDGIYHKDINAVIERNSRKRMNIAKLLAKKELNIFKLKIPYFLYYYSVNIDHFYFDKLNITSEEKHMLARSYSAEIIKKGSETGKLKKFYSDIDRINPTDFPKDYKLSWTYIQADNNCLKRCTNVGLIK